MVGGGFCERMVDGDAKNLIYKIFRRSKLSFFALLEVVLEDEVILNNCPLGYLEHDIQYPPLARDILVFVTNITLPEDHIDSDIGFKHSITSKKFMHIRTTKDIPLRERHNCANGKTPSVKVADTVQVKGEQRNRGEWKIGLIAKTILVSNVLVSAKIRLRKIALME